jgi:hypothetical protein
MGFLPYKEKPDRGFTALDYRFYSGGKYATLTVGDFYGFMSLVRTLSTVQHITLLRMAFAKRRPWLDAHQQVVKKDDANEKVRLECESCEWALCCPRGCLRSKPMAKGSRVRIKTCERCLLRGLRSSKKLSICWPMDRELFVQIGAIDEQGIPVVNPVGLAGCVCDYDRDICRKCSTSPSVQ